MFPPVVPQPKKPGSSEVLYSIALGVGSVAQGVKMPGVIAAFSGVSGTALALSVVAIVAGLGLLGHAWFML